MQRLLRSKSLMVVVTVTLMLLFVIILCVSITRGQVRADAVSVKDSFVAVNDVYQPVESELEQSASSDSSHSSQVEARGISESSDSSDNEQTESSDAVAEINYNEDGENTTSSDTSIQALAFDKLKADFDKLQAGDTSVIEKYFGTGEQMTPESVADRVSASSIKLLNLSDIVNTSSIVVHVCSIDYEAMNKDYATLCKSDSEETDAKTELATSLADGKYDVCYNIVLSIDPEATEAVINEQFKQAITGGWYQGLGENLEEVPHE